MRHTKRLFSIIAIGIFGLAIVGCDSGGSDMGGELSPDEAKTQVQNVDSDLSADVSELNSGEFSTTMKGLFTTSSSTTSGKNSHVPLGFVLLDSLENVIQTTDGRLDFAGSSGEYNWDSQNGWTSAGASDDVILNFPTAWGASNTATFTLSDYSDTNVTIDGDSEYLPETVNASLTVQGNEIFAVDLTGTQFYSEQVNGTQVPKSFLLSVLTVPHRHTFELSSPSRQEFEVAFDLVKPENDDQLVLGLSAVASLKSNVEDVSDAEDIDELSGAVNLGPNVDLDYTLQVDQLAALGDDPSAQEVNNNFTATLLYQDQKVGDIELGQDKEPVLIYNNGDQEPLAQAFDNTYGTVSGSGSGTVTSAVQTAAERVQSAVSSVFRH